MNFEDKNEYQGTTHYPVCNESVQRWKEVLKDVRVKVGGGIAGGGEVSLFGILPSVTDRLVLVDHSYISLWACVGKYGTIKQLGPEKAIKLLQSPPPYASGGGYDANGKRSAGGKYNQYGELVDRNPYSHKLVKPTEELYSCFVEANKGLATETDRMEECGWWPLAGLDGRWGEIEVKDCEALLNSKTELRVYHGDISDLTEHAPLELLYLSNALSYNGRNGKDFKVGEIVEKGSFLAWTGSGGDPYRTKPSTATITVGGVKCKPIEHVKPRNSITSSHKSTFYDGSWTYSLAQVV